MAGRGGRGDGQRPGSRGKLSERHAEAVPAIVAVAGPFVSMVMGTGRALAAALDDMLKARQQRALALGQKARCDLSMRVLDEMLEDLEQLNLRGVRRVPGSFEPRITALAEVLVPGTGDLPPMRTNISPVRLMDMVFDLQERVLEVRSGGSPAVLEVEAEYEDKEPVAS